jgi:hypothetical protein
MAAGAVIALAGIAGCGGGGPVGATGAGGVTGQSVAAAANGALGLNGPFGRGGPFEGGGIGAAGRAGTAGTRGTAGTGGGKSGTAAASGPAGRSEDKVAGRAGGSEVKVGGSAAMDGVEGMPWLFALGAGVSASAPQTVRPGTGSPADAATGFYQAFYGQRFAAACDYVAPAQRSGCPARLRGSAGSADALRTPAIGFAVVKGGQALVTMTGALCRAASGCIGQQDPHWVFDNSYTFGQLWARTAGAGGNPLTVTPLTRDAGRWYVDLTAAAGR